MAARNEDSKQGLIIALVFFVLLSLTLGVTTYLGYDGQRKLDDDTKKAKADADAAKKEAEQQKFVALAIADFAGHLPKSYAADRQGLWVKFDEMVTKGEDEAAANIQKLKAQFGQDPGSRRPGTTYAQEVARLTQELQNRELTLRKFQDSAADAEKKLKQELQGATASFEQAVKNLDKANKELAAERAKKGEEYLALEKKSLELQVERENQERKIGELIEDGKKKQTENDKRYTDLDNRRKKLEDVIVKPSLIDYDQPKGKIVRLDRTGTTAWINLGSADKVREGLTFSVSGIGPDGKPVRERKARIEVVNVLSDHLSTARLKMDGDEAEKSRRNPVLEGDLLFNPGWNPGQAEHVAIAGVIDLYGESRDSVTEFIALLRKQGIEVDQYVDTKTGDIKGDGITLNTAYLIMGDNPTEGSVRFDAKTDAKSDLSKKVSDAMAAMQGDANRNGVTVVSFRKFVTLVGLPIPKVPTVRNQDFRPRGDKAVPKKDAEKDAPKTEEKKDEGK